MNEQRLCEDCKWRPVTGRRRFCDTCRAKRDRESKERSRKRPIQRQHKADYDQRYKVTHKAVMRANWQRYYAKHGARINREKRIRRTFRTYSPHRFKRFLRAWRRLGL